MTDAQIVDAILSREGAFVDHPADRGGPTSWGITLPTLERYRGHSVGVGDIKSLTKDEARLIYVKLYVEPWGDILSDHLRALLVDCAVNHGHKATVKMLQRSVAVSDDGIYGKDTHEALQDIGADSVYLRLCGQRMRFYGAIISGDHSQAVFAKGWLTRVAEFVEDAA